MGGLPGLKMLAGGEPLWPDARPASARSGASLWNLYGPTETTVYATARRHSEEDVRITVGRPLANYTTYVVDGTLTCFRSARLEGLFGWNRCRGRPIKLACNQWPNLLHSLSFQGLPTTLRSLHRDLADVIDWRYYVCYDNQ